MEPRNAEITIFVAEDDPDDQLLLEEAFAEAELNVKTQFFADGELLLQGLRHAASGAEAEEARPNLILMDMNMPRMSGREALSEIKADPNLAQIPVIILTTARNRNDIAQTCDFTDSAFFTKPNTFKDLVCLVRMLPSHWLRWTDPASDRPLSAA